MALVTPVSTFGQGRFDFELIGVRYRYGTTVGTATQRSGTPVVWTFSSVATGISGTVADRAALGALRSMQLQCQQRFPSGLTAGSRHPLALIGTNSVTPWGPDICTQGGPARALRVGGKSMGCSQVWSEAVQMICEQPLVK
jgi:hypothetical protein